MKKLYILLAGVVLSTGMLWAADPVGTVVETPATKAARVEVAKVLAIKDSVKAAEQLTAAIRAMYKDNDGQAAKDGVPELTIALLVKTDFERSKEILPLMFLSLTEGMPLNDFERLVASAVLAAESNAVDLTTAILNGLQGKNRWIESVTTVAKDTPRPLPNVPPPPPPPYAGQ